MEDLCLHTHEEPKRVNVDPTSCPGCSLPFNETKNAPLLLDCGDSYCATCAKQAQPITCPVCFVVTTQSADELKKNAALITMLPLLRFQKPAQEPCTNCSKAAATLFCGACKALCQPCSSDLHSHKALSSHSVVALSERGSLQAPMCVEHAGQNLVLYCPVEGALICLVCKDFGAHKGHAGIMAATDAAKQKRDELRKIKEQAIEAQKLERHTAAIEKSQDDLKRESSRARGELERYFEQMHGALHTRKAEMLRGINEQESKMNNAFDTQKFELTKACSTLQAVAEQADKVCQGNDTQILQAVPVVFPQVQVLSRPCFSAVEFSLFLPALQKQSAESKFLSCHDKVAVDLVEALAV